MAKEAPGGEEEPGASWKIFEEFEGVGLIFENMEKSDSVRGKKTKEMRRRMCRIWRKEDLGNKIRC